jgi:hypothetical protein
MYSKMPKFVFKMEITIFLKSFKGKGRGGDGGT